MLERIKEAIIDGFRTPVESFRLKFEREHDPLNIARKEDGTYVIAGIEYQWQQALKAFNEEQHEKFIDNQW